MDFEKEEVELYDQYLNFVRRMIIDELELNIENPYDLDLEVAELLPDGMRFIFTNEMGSWTYKAIDYHQWYKMKVRSERLNQLGL